jgi:hypothetical protein
VDLGKLDENISDVNQSLNGFRNKVTTNTYDIFSKDSNFIKEIAPLLGLDHYTTALTKSEYDKAVKKVLSDGSIVRQYDDDGKPTSKFMTPGEMLLDKISAYTLTQYTNKNLAGTLTPDDELKYGHVISELGRIKSYENNLQDILNFRETHNNKFREEYISDPQKIKSRFTNEQTRKMIGKIDPVSGLIVNIQDNLYDIIYGKSRKLVGDKSVLEFVTDEDAMKIAPHLASRLLTREAGDRIFVLHWDGEEPTVYLSQRDVRELQFAKASIATGWRLLLEEVGLVDDDVQQVLLAGSFGSYLSPASAIGIGLVPL